MHDSFLRLQRGVVACVKRMCSTCKLAVPIKHNHTLMGCDLQLAYRGQNFLRHENMLVGVRTQALPERTRLAIVRPNFQGESLALKISRGREDGVERGDTHQPRAEPSVDLRLRSRDAATAYSRGRDACCVGVVDVVDVVDVL